MRDMGCKMKLAADALLQSLAVPVPNGKADS